MAIFTPTIPLDVAAIPEQNALRRNQLNVTPKICERFGVEIVAINIISAFPTNEKLTSALAAGAVAAAEAEQMEVSAQGVVFVGHEVCIFSALRCVWGSVGGDSYFCLGLFFVNADSHVVDQELSRIFWGGSENWCAKRTCYVCHNSTLVHWKEKCGIRLPRSTSEQKPQCGSKNHLTVPQKAPPKR